MIDPTSPLADDRSARTARYGMTPRTWAKILLHRRLSLSRSSDTTDRATLIPARRVTAKHAPHTPQSDTADAGVVPGTGNTRHAKRKVDRLESSDEFDVTDSLREWAHGAPNEGWALIDKTGREIDAGQWSAWQARLVIQFWPPPVQINTPPRN